MPANSKPRKKYRPKLNLKDPVGYLLEGLRPVTDHGSLLLDSQLKNSCAMAALMQGGSTRRDMSTLLNMSNMCESLLAFGFGAAHKDVATQGREALIRIAQRAATVGLFVPAGPDITALNALMELHDAQLEVITVADMQRSIEDITTKLARGQTTRLPSLPQGA